MSFRLSYNLQIWILVEYYIRINQTFGFIDLFPISCEILLGLGPFQIKIYYISSLLEDKKKQKKNGGRNQDGRQA
jgi:hypothetical protein